MEMGHFINPLWDDSTVNIYVVVTLIYIVLTNQWKESGTLRQFHLKVTECKKEYPVAPRPIR